MSELSEIQKLAMRVRDLEWATGLRSSEGLAGDRRTSASGTRATSEPAHLPVQSLSRDPLDARVEALFKDVDTVFKSSDDLCRCAEHFDDLIQARAATVLRLKFEEVDVLLKFPADVSHNSSPSVGAPDGALCDNSNPKAAASGTDAAPIEHGAASDTYWLLSKFGSVGFADEGVERVFRHAVPSQGDPAEASRRDIEDTPELLVNCWQHSDVVLEGQRAAGTNQDRVVNIFPGNQAGSSEIQRSLVRKLIKNHLLHGAGDRVRKVEDDALSADAVNHSCHESSPSVGAPSGAVCDNPNPTDGELNPGAASSPKAPAPGPNPTRVQE